MKYIAMMWKKIFDYKGKSDRKEFWIPFTCSAVIAMLLVLMIFLRTFSPAAAVAAIIFGVYLTVSAVPFVSLTVRRLHDTGRSGWWYWLVFAFGVGAVVLVMMLAGASDTFDPSDNANVSVYGPPDRYEEFTDEEITEITEFDPEDNVEPAVYGPPDYDPKYDEEETEESSVTEETSESVYSAAQSQNQGSAKNDSAALNAVTAAVTTVTSAAATTTAATETTTAETTLETTAETTEEETLAETEAEENEEADENINEDEPFMFIETDNISPVVYGPPEFFETDTEDSESE